MNSTLGATAAVLILAFVSPALSADPEHRTERVRLAAGSTSTVIAGKITGYRYVDYLVQAGAGQTLAVAMKTSNGANYFNVNPPGTEASMFIGSSSGSDFRGVIPDDGEYTIRVYLMRSAARRKESADYNLTVGVTGRPLAAVPASVGALVPGTRFHASAPIPCMLPFHGKPEECKAFVVRRGFDGTATLEIQGSSGFRRRILFVKGAVVSSDSPDPLSAARRGDLVTITGGSEERYELREALIVGG